MASDLFRDVQFTPRIPRLAVQARYSQILASLTMTVCSFHRSTRLTPSTIATSGESIGVAQPELRFIRLGDARQRESE